jgi:hypothetical protein
LRSARRSWWLRTCSPAITPPAGMRAMFSSCPVPRRQARLRAPDRDDDHTVPGSSLTTTSRRSPRRSHRSKVGHGPHHCLGRGGRRARGRRARRRRQCPRHRAPAARPPVSRPPARLRRRASSARVTQRGVVVRRRPPQRAGNGRQTEGSETPRRRQRHRASTAGNGAERHPGRLGYDNVLARRTKRPHRDASGHPREQCTEQ